MRAGAEVGALTIQLEEIGESDSFALDFIEDPIAQRPERRRGYMIEFEHFLAAFLKYLTRLNELAKPLQRSTDMILELRPRRVLRE